jgi:mannose-6-phosphate isomerase-like protein (cupin superfamily)
VANYTAKRIDDMDSAYGGAYKRARAELGVQSFGMQVLDLPPNLDRFPEHDHSEDGQEEVYLLLRGAAEIDVDGERFALEAETPVRIPAGVRRKLYTGSEPARILALGGTPGQVYDAPEVSKLPGPDSLPQAPQVQL